MKKIKILFLQKNVSKNHNFIILKNLNKLSIIFHECYENKNYDINTNGEKFILKNRDKHIYDKSIIIVDAKTKLQEYSLKKFKSLPIYKFISGTGPKHKPLFKTDVEIPNTKKATGTGNSKKSAQQNAAHKLLKFLEVL